MTWRVQVLLGVVAGAVAACGPAGPIDDDAGVADPDGGFEPEPVLLVYENDPAPAAGDDLLFEWPDDTAPWRVVELDAVRSGDGVDIALTVDDDTESVLLLAQTTPNAFLIPVTVTGPGGEVYVTDTPPDDLLDADVTAARGFPAQLFSPARALVQRGTLSYLLPNTPDVLFAPGTYRARIGVFQAVGAEPVPASLPIRVAAVFKPKLAPGTPRTLHLTVTFQTPLLDAQSAPTDPMWAAAEQRVREVFGQAGIVVDDLVYQDLNMPAFDTVTLADETCDGADLSALFATTPAPARPTAQLFIVEAFSCTIGGFDVGPGIAGISGGIPAAWPLAANANGGVAVARSFFDDQPGQLGNIIAHEVSHALGLFHTQERSRPTQTDVFDIVSDTPEEEPAVLQNLMYFISNDFTDLTDGQAAVLRAHPLIQGP